MISLIILLIPFLLGCGGKKKKAAAKKAAPEIPPENKTPVSKVSEVPTALKSADINDGGPKKPANGATDPPKIQTPPKPVIADTKVAEMLPDSPPKSDEMKEGIKLPTVKAMKCEGDVDGAKAAESIRAKKKNKSKEKDKMEEII